MGHELGHGRPDLGRGPPVWHPGIRRTTLWGSLLTSGLIQAVRKKTAGLHVALRGNFSAPVRVTDLVEVLKDATSLVVCTRKKVFGWGMRIFCEWRQKWRTFWLPWTNSPGPGSQPLDGSIALKCLLETRLQSESFDTLDDLLGFRFKSDDISQ